MHLYPLWKVPPILGFLELSSLFRLLFAFYRLLILHDLLTINGQKDAFLVAVRSTSDVTGVGPLVTKLYVWDNKNSVVIFCVCLLRDVFVALSCPGIIEW